MILEQMRRGIARLIAIDSDTGTVTRPVMADNGRGEPVPTGETEEVTQFICRVSYQSGGVWPAKPAESGLTIDTTPYVLAAWDEDLRQGDMLAWRGKRYSVGPVTRPQIEGGSVCVQAPLTEVK
jgi:hypothetical protein